MATNEELKKRIEALEKELKELEKFAKENGYNDELKDIYLREVIDLSLIHI